MCLVARHLEAQGIPTLIIGSALDILRAGRPPRALYVDYPLGHSVGRPFDPVNQREIIGDAIAAFDAIEAPETIIELDYQWHEGDQWRTEATDLSSGDTRAPRDTSPQYQIESDREAARAQQSAI